MMSLSYGANEFVSKTNACSPCETDILKSPEKHSPLVSPAGSAETSLAGVPELFWL